MQCLAKTLLTIHIFVVANAAPSSASKRSGAHHYIGARTVHYGIASPKQAIGLEDNSEFVKVFQIGQTTKWIQTIDGVPVYGTVLTTHTDKQGRRFFRFDVCVQPNVTIEFIVMLND